ncbi:AI-2E family transporter, partial [bacterium]|nr:AI-2E family transporter [bacterium]
LSEVYREVAPSIAQFGRLLGRAFEAQTMIAACNTIVTFTGMKLLGIPGTLILSIVVFMCSFIPVAGVFISTTPIAITALLMEGGGPKTLVGVIAMVTFAHILEAYVLNPRIYGHHMKMNTLAVLVILIIAEHSVGVWGLVVAIPLATYVWRYLVLGEDDEPAPRPRASAATGAPPAAPPPDPAPAPAVPSFGAPAVPTFGQQPASVSATERR